MDKKLILLIGPTATGKTAVAEKLATCLKGEIISADSRALYKGMDIGTAKPSSSQVRYHLIDIKNPQEHYDAMQFRRDVTSAVKDILKRGKQPIITGGSTLYIKALTDKFFKGPSADPRIREKLKKIPLRELYQRLKEIDPLAAKRIQRGDPQRIIRALEVYELTGRPISKLQQESADEFAYRRWLLKIGLCMNRKKLYQRINERVDQMIQKGLIDEARKLYGIYGKLPQTQVHKTIGYCELFSYFEGQISLKEAIRLIKRNTRRYAKRQLTWFKRDPQIQWVDVSNKSTDQIVKEIMSLLDKALLTS